MLSRSAEIIRKCMSIDISFSFTYHTEREAVLYFCHSKVSKLDSKVSILNSINSQTASNVSKLDSSLDPQNVRVSRIKDRVESFKFRVTVNLHLTGTGSELNFWDNSVIVSISLLVLLLQSMTPNCIYPVLLHMEALWIQKLH